MTSKFIPPTPQPGGSSAPTANISLNDLTDIVCDKCGDFRFEPVYLIKKLSPLLSPDGTEKIVPLGPPALPPIFACYNCGHINSIFVKFMNVGKPATEEPTIKQSTLTLHKD